MESAGSPNMTLLQVCDIDADGLAPELNLVGRYATTLISGLTCAYERHSTDRLHDELTA